MCEAHAALLSTVDGESTLLCRYSFVKIRWDNCHGEIGEVVVAHDIKVDDFITLGLSSCITVENHVRADRGLVQPKGFKHPDRWSRTSMKVADGKVQSDERSFCPIE